MEIKNNLDTLDKIELLNLIEEIQFRLKIIALSETVYTSLAYNIINVPDENELIKIINLLASLQNENLAKSIINHINSENKSKKHTTTYKNFYDFIAKHYPTLIEVFLHG